MIKKITREQQIAIAILCHKTNWSYGSIAKKLNLSRSTIKKYETNKYLYTKSEFLSGNTLNTNRKKRKFLTNSDKKLISYFLNHTPVCEEDLTKEFNISRMTIWRYQNYEQSCRQIVEPEKPIIHKIKYPIQLSTPSNKKELLQEIYEEYIGKKDNSRYLLFDNMKDKLIGWIENNYWDKLSKFEEYSSQEKNNAINSFIQCLEKNRKISNYIFDPLM